MKGTETYKRVRLTPTLAAKFLAKNTPDNRYVSKSHVNQMAHAIRADSFPFTGQPILFSNGHMIDGQHRCHAVIAADRSIDVLVVSGVAEDVFRHIDQGKKRSASDFIEHRCRTQIAAAGRLAYFQRLCEERGTEFRGDRGGPQDSPDNDELLKFISSTNLIELANEIENPRRMARIIPIGTGLYCIWRLSQISKDDCDLFMSALIDGTSQAEGDPIWLLREHLLTIAGSSTRGPISKTMGRAHIIAAIFLAWNCYRNDEEIKRTRVWRATGPKAAKFPVPI